MFEKEFKVMLTEEQHDKLVAAYNWDKVFTQINHYYDTPDLQLSKEHITCRVRETEGEYFLQLKTPTPKDYIRVEIAKKLPALPETLTSEMLREVSRYDLPDVNCIGKLTTLRHVHQFEGGEIDLDRSEYFGKVDYELEIEFTGESAARSMLAEICELLGISPESDVCPGKIHRFMDEYSKR